MNVCCLHLDMKSLFPKADYLLSLLERFAEMGYTHIRNGKTPRLLGLPQAYQCTTWVTEPEAMAYETAAFFINRWEASELYLFTGLDGRCWQVMGKLNNAIAQIDQFVFEGVKLNGIKMEQVSPYPHPMAVYDGNNPILSKHAEAIRKESLVTL